MVECFAGMREQLGSEFESECVRDKEKTVVILEKEIENIMGR